MIKFLEIQISRERERERERERGGGGGEGMVLVVQARVGADNLIKSFEIVIVVML